MRSTGGRWPVGIVGILLFLLTSGAASALAQTGVITTIAGGGANKMSATSAYLPWPTSVVLDKAGNVYAAVAGLDEVVKIDPTGNLTVVAGTGYAGYSGDNGLATSATLDLSGAYLGVAPAIALDASGNLYIADDVNSVIRRVDAATGIITTVVGNGTAGYSGDGGPATGAELNFPMGIAFDSAGNLFIADNSNNVIRRVDATTSIITTVAGNGNAAYSGDGEPAVSASLNGPDGIFLDGSGNLYIADTFNNVVRRVDGSTGIITTVAGNSAIGYSYSGDGGLATNAGMNQPSAVMLDASGNLLIADGGNEVIRRVNATTSVITTIAGNGTPGFSGDGGQATSANLNLAGNMASQIGSLALDSAGNLYIPDSWNMRIRVLYASTGDIGTLAGGGTGGDGGLGSDASLDFPTSLVLDGLGDLYVEDLSDGRVRRIDAVTGAISTVAGNGIPIAFAPSIGDGGPATSADLPVGVGMTLDSSGNLFISESWDGRVRRVDAITGTITTVAGAGATYCNPGNVGDGGPATSACLAFPHGVAVDGSGNLYIADRNNRRIRKVDAATGTISTIAGTGTRGCTGDGGPATDAELGGPFAITLDSSENIFFADCNNIRRVDASTGVITTVAGNGTAVYSGDGGMATSAGIGTVQQLIVDRLGNIFIADAFFNRIRRVDAISGLITTIAGSGSAVLGGGAFSGDGGLATNATLNAPYGIALNASGDLLISDSADNRIRKVPLPPFVGFQPYAVSFSNQTLGTSATQKITLESTGTAVLLLSTMSFSGANAADFKISGSTCSSTLTSGKTCSVDITFTPTALGSESAILNVPTNALFSPQTIGLTGTSVAPTAAVTISGSMEGNLAIHPGDTVEAGYDFTMPGSHPEDVVGFMNGTVTLTVNCPDGSTPSIVINLPLQSYDDLANSSAWLPSGEQSSPLVYQGSTTAYPCGSATGYAPKGAVFHALVSSTVPGAKINVRFHYSDNSAGGWSSTATVKP